MRCTPFLIGDATYPICTYLEKNWKTHNLVNVDKTKFQHEFWDGGKKKCIKFFEKKMVNFETFQLQS